MSKTPFADDETLEYIASLEQRNAEAERLLRDRINGCPTCIITGKQCEPCTDARAFLAKTKE